MDDFLKNIDINNEEQMNAFALSLIKKMEEEGQSLSSLLNISDGLLEELYRLGYNYYNQGKYKEALTLFYTLTGVAPQNDRYMFALAASFHQLKDYQSAAFGFTVAYSLNLKNPLPVYYAADCLINIKQFEEAIVILDKAIEVSADQGEYQALKQRCILLKKSLIENINNQ
jgi:type III secretion system low calcium response chaperone LcrH/SycD